jgi:hypothetical protein
LDIEVLIFKFLKFFNFLFFEYFDIFENFEYFEIVEIFNLNFLIFYFGPWDLDFWAGNMRLAT